MRSTNDFQKAIQRLAAEYQNLQTVRLGKLDGVTVETGTDGLLWARQWNGKEIKVYNRALAPADFDLRVLVGIYRTQPGKWFILQTMEDYLTPAGGGRMAYHHSQHEFGGPDEVVIDRKQIIAFTVRPYSGFQVRVYGGYFPTPAGLAYTPTQLVDLTSHAPAYGALYACIEVDDSGTLSVNVGANFGAPTIGTISNVPAPAAGKYHVASILLYETQSAVSDADIAVPTPLGVMAKSTGLQISEADADTPLDADKWGFWDAVDLALKNITWANIKATLKTYFDTLYASALTDHINDTLDAHDASAVSLATGTFDNNLDGTVVNVQLLAQAVDDLTAGGGGGSPLVFDDLTAQIPATGDHYDFSSEATGDLFLFHNGSYIPDTEYTLDMDGLGLTCDTFSPSGGDTLVAVYGTVGVGLPPGGTTGQVLAKASNTNYDVTWADGGGTVSSSPTLKIYMHDSFR